MKTHSLGLVAALFISSATALSAAWDHQQQLTPEAAKGRLVVNGLNGDVTIEGVDGTELSIHSPDLEPPEEARREKRQNLPTGMRSLLTEGGSDIGVGFDIKTEGNVVQVTAAQPHLEADFVFRVPRTMSVQLAGVLNGDVAVSGMAGELEIVVTEGDITVADAAAPVVIQAVNGDVTVVFATYPTKRPSSVNSVEGSVTVQLPANAAAELDLHTINGDIFTDLPVEVKERRVMQWGGPKSVRGLLNGGGARLSINCINDDVIVRGPDNAPPAPPASPKPERNPPAPQ